MGAKRPGLILIFLLLAVPASAAEESKRRSFIEDLLTLPFTAPQEIEKALESSIFNLGEVKVSSSRLASRLGDAEATSLPHNITLIGATELGESGEPYLPAVLNRKEGVTQTDETGLGLNARVDLRGFGGEAKQALVLFDGLRAVEPFDNSVTWHLYPAEFTRQVEIERGGGSTVYGEGALSGNIRLLTKDPTEKPRVTGEAAWGSFDLERYFVDASGTARGVGFYAGARYATTSGYRRNSDHEGVQTLLKAEYPLTDLVRVKNAFYFADNETGIPGPLSQAEVDRDRRRQDPDGQPGDRFNDRLVQDGFTVSWLIEDLGVEVTDQLGYRLRMQDSIQSFGGLFGGTSVNEIETETFSNVLQGAWSFEAAHFRSDFTTGAEWSKDDIYNPFEFTSLLFGPFASERAIDRRMVGFFVQDRIELWDKLILEAGLRSDQIDWDIYDLKVPSLQKAKEAHHASPKLGAEWKVFEVLSVYGNFAESFKVPDANTLIFETPNIFTPNPDIDPQLARHHELGVRYAHPVFGSVRADVFYIETKKEILFNDISNLNENFDTKRQGVELAGEVAVAKGAQLFANYTYTQAEFDNGAFDGKTIPLVPKSKWSAGFLLTPDEHWKISVQATGVYDAFALNDFNNRFPADDYWVLGGQIAYARHNWEVFVRVQNALGEEYTTFATSNGVNTVNLNPMPEVTVEGGVRIEL